MSRRIDLMIDLECAGPAPNGAIVSIGWCAFALDGKKNSTGSKIGPVSNLAVGRIDVIVQSCIDIGMEIDSDTVGWWFRQDPEVRALWNAPGAVPIREALRQINQRYLDNCTLGSGGPGVIWAYPSTYDLSILDRAVTLCGMKMDFGRKDYLCSRSVMKGLGYRRSDERIPARWRQKHLPENDAVRQAIQLQLCLVPEVDRDEDPLGYPGDGVARFD